MVGGNGVDLPTSQISGFSLYAQKSCPEKELTFGQEPSYLSGLYRAIAVIYCLYVVLALIDLRRHGVSTDVHGQMRSARDFGEPFQREDVHFNTT